MNNESNSVINSCELESDKLGDPYVGVEHLMLSILKFKELGCTKVLTNRDITYKTFKEKLKGWWHTDCVFCQRMRWVLLWLLLMCGADYLWFHLLFTH